jgi:hypothetical protein
VVDLRSLLSSLLVTLLHQILDHPANKVRKEEMLVHTLIKQNLSTYNAL